MSKKIFVGNLPYSVTEDQLKDLFAQMGEVSSANVVTDRATGRSKGFGFIEMNNDDEALTAIEQLGGSQLDGRAITVSEAKPREEGPRRSSGGGGGGYGGGGGGGGRRTGGGYGGGGGGGYGGGGGGYGGGGGNRGGY